MLHDIQDTGKHVQAFRRQEDKFLKSMESNIPRFWVTQVKFYTLIVRQYKKPATNDYHFDS